MERKGVLAGLLLLTLGPLPLVGWLGLKGIGVLETRQGELARRTALTSLGEELAGALEALARGKEVVNLGRSATSIPLAGEELVADSGTVGRVSVALTPSGDPLADPSAERARARAHEGRDIEALEALEGLLIAPDPRRRAVGMLEAAEILADLGHAERALDMARAAAGAIDEEGPWRRWSAAHLTRWEHGDEEALRALEAWLGDVHARPTSLEELVLLGHVAGRIDGSEALLRELAERRTRPRTRRWLRRALAALPAGETPALVRFGDRFMLATRGADGLAWGVSGLEAWLAAWRGPAGERARLHTNPDEPSPSELAVVLARESGAGARPVDLGELPVAVTFRDAPLFGGWNPRALLAGALAAYAALALLALRALRSQERQARRLAAARGDLIAEVTHELRTPLTVLRMYAETLNRGRLAPDSQRDYLDTIQREAVRLGELVDHVAEVARGEAPRRPADEPLDPNAVLERLVAEVRPVVVAAGGTIVLETTDAEADAGSIRGDAEELRRVLELLVDNAVRYSGASPRIEVATALAKNRWTTTVRDHGPGIPPEERARVFERWVRGTSGREGGRRGAGMGLFLARRGARVLGGELTLEFPEDGGTCARLELPATAPPEVAS